MSVLGNSISRINAPQQQAPSACLRREDGDHRVVARKPLAGTAPFPYATTMFVRFRQHGRRLQASLMHTRRVAGKMQSEHIASLGSVDADVSVRERLAFWIEIEERLARLGNRVGPDDRDKIIAALAPVFPS